MTAQVPPRNGEADRATRGGGVSAPAEGDAPPPSFGWCPAPYRGGSLAIRRVRADDLPALVALLDDDERSKGREDASLPLDPRYPAAFAEIDGNPDQLLVVAEQAGAIVGTMQLTFIPGVAFRGAWRMQIEAVRIASAVRGQGLGAAMIAWAVDRARDRGCRMVQLTSMSTRTEAHRFYERLGFVKSHVGMKLQLAEQGA